MVESKGHLKHALLNMEIAWKGSVRSRGIAYVCREGFMCMCELSF